MITFILDSRNQKDSFVEKALNDLGHKTSRDFKLSFGDVAKSTNVFNTIDLKSSGGGLIELAKNVCSKDHNRLKMEILKALNKGGQITFLCFEPNIHSIDDIATWQVPTFKSSLYKNGKCLHKKGEKMTKVAPETLMKALKTITTQDHYAPNFKVNLEFTTKDDCGRKIVEIFDRMEKQQNESNQ